MADTTVFTTDLGAVTAYADAVANGYTGALIPVEYVNGFQS